MTTPNVLLPQLIHKDKLRFLAGNSNRQTKHVFEELRKNIREQGFDESLIVVPFDEDTYTVVSGNHRGKAGMEEGIEEFPCVVRKDWDEVTTELQSVRRNYSRGKIDKNLFTAQVETIKERFALSNTDIMEGMAFESLDALAALYKAEKEAEEESYEKMQEEASSDATTVKVVDDLGAIVTHLVQMYGDTIPHSFMIIPVGGKQHLYIKSNSALKKAVQNIAAACVVNKLDINVALTGIISIGLDNTDFLEGQGVDAIKEANAVDGDDEEFEIIQ